MTDTTTVAPAEELSPTSQFKKLATRLAVIGFLIALALLIVLSFWQDINLNYNQLSFGDGVQEVTTINFAHPSGLVLANAFYTVLSNLPLILGVAAIAVLITALAVFANSLLSKSSHETLVDARAVLTSRVVNSIINTLAVAIAALGFLIVLSFIVLTLSGIFALFLEPSETGSYGFFVVLINTLVLGIVFVILTLVSSTHLGTSTAIHDELAALTLVAQNAPHGYVERIARAYPQSLTQDHPRVGVDFATTAKVYLRSYFPYIGVLGLLAAASAAADSAYGRSFFLFFAALIQSFVVFGYFTLVYQEKRTTLRTILATLNVLFLLLNVFFTLAFLLSLFTWPVGQILFTLGALCPFIYLLAVQAVNYWFMYTESDSLPAAVFFPKNFAISFLPAQIAAPVEQGKLGWGLPENIETEDK